MNCFQQTTDNGLVHLKTAFKNAFQNESTKWSCWNETTINFISDLFIELKNEYNEGLTEIRDKLHALQVAKNETINFVENNTNNVRLILMV